MSTVPLADQLAAFDAGWERACSRLRDYLDHGPNLHGIRALARQRLIDGFDSYGDAACHWDADRIEREADEELADYLVYQTIGGLANDS